MKKNILLVQSLLALPLMTLSMDTPDTTTLTKSKRNVGVKRQQARLKALGVEQITAELRQREQDEAKQDLQAAKNLPFAIATDNKKFDIDQFQEMLAAIKKGAALDEFNHVETTVTYLMDWLRKSAMTTHFEARTKASSVPKITKEILKQERELAIKDMKEATDLLENNEGLLELLAQIQEASLQLKHIEALPTASSAQQASVKMELTEDLAQSVMTIVENEGFSLATTLRNAMKTYRQVVIELLETDSFDVSKHTHKVNFDQALEECAQQKDMSSLKKILDICQAKKQYQSLQSAANHVAPAFNYVSDHYQTQIASSNEMLKAYNQELALQINAEATALKENLMKQLKEHAAKVTMLAERYHAKAKSELAKEEELKGIINGVAGLNTKVKPHQQALLSQHYLVVPENNVKAIENSTHQTVRALISHSNLPQASVLQIDKK